jgi:RNA polymerase sigma-70 factor, ECF subfamily
MSDGDLVRQCLAGHSPAYEVLVGRWAARVLALCHARVSRREVAEDMAQETLLRGFKSLSSLIEPDKFGSWLCGIASRTCLDWLKSKQRTQIPFSVLASDGELDGILARQAGPAEKCGDADDLLAAIEALPDAYRETLLLYYYDDVTYQELADLLGVSTATINARLTKARQMLRERMERQKK